MPDPSFGAPGKRAPGEPRWCGPTRRETRKKGCSAPFPNPRASNHRGPGFKQFKGGEILAG
ncbi:MAG: hypothetical protein CM15mP77_1980 [Synechococcus sp.]|nr:MAG: hypothetical protein CM15mP77_1980 [Synechococcus sp.]